MENFSQLESRQQKRAGGSPSSDTPVSPPRSAVSMPCKAASGAGSARDSDYSSSNCAFTDNEQQSQQDTWLYYCEAEPLNRLPASLMDRWVCVLPEPGLLNYELQKNLAFCEKRDIRERRSSFTGKGTLLQRTAKGVSEDVL